jgi:hypothetical protein
MHCSDNTTKTMRRGERERRQKKKNVVKWQQKLRKRKWTMHERKSKADRKRICFLFLWHGHQKRNEGE